MSSLSPQLLLFSLIYPPLRNRLATAEKAAEKEYLYDSNEIDHNEANDERPETI